MNRQNVDMVAVIFDIISDFCVNLGSVIFTAVDIQWSSGVIMLMFHCVLAGILFMSGV